MITYKSIRPNNHVSRAGMAPVTSLSITVFGQTIYSITIADINIKYDYNSFSFVFFIGGLTVKILIAEDTNIYRKQLIWNLSDWGYEVITTNDGLAAWNTLKDDKSINFVILDWIMPELEGPEVCRMIRDRKGSRYIYIIILTSMDSKEDIVEGLKAGADDYIFTPFDPQELHYRIQVGERILNLELSLEKKVGQLKDALSHVKKLQGLLPICMHCKKIRNDQNTWQQIESYLEEHSEAMFSHSICKECKDKYYPELKLAAK